MKKGFTMIELIFVIVILGILAAVAIPRLAATRDDAKAAAIKTDIGTAIQAVPAWYQGQKDVVIANAMSIDTSTWSKTNQKQLYTYKENSSDTDRIILRIVDANSSDNALTTTTAVDDNITSFTYEPWFVVDINGSTNNGIVKTLTNSMGVTSSAVAMGGQKVKW